MSIDIKQFTGNIWEELCQKVLHLRYKEDYQKVPDRFRGDLGIEGFTFSGCVFQFYCPDESLTAKELYEKQRDKITVDTNKLFIYNEEYKKLLGTIIIKEWDFIIPCYENKELIKHCRKKENEIKEKNLSYIDDNFKIKLLTYDHFLPELNFLMNIDEQALFLTPVNITDEEIYDWKEKQNKSYNEMRKKLKKVFPMDVIEDKVDLYLKLHLIGSKYLSQILSEFPEIYDRIIRKKNDFAIKMEAFGPLYEITPSQYLKKCFDDYEKEINEKAVIQKDKASYIAFEAIGEWLINCTLDF